MYKIYKDAEYFGVCYNNMEMAIKVCIIFSETIEGNFIIKVGGDD